MRRVALVLLFMFALLAVPMVAQAAEVHVSTTGSDTVGSGSVGSPFETVARAMTAAGFGDTIMVGEGTFACAVTLKNGVSMIGAGYEKTVLQGDGVNPVISVAGLSNAGRISGFTITGGYCPTGSWGGGIRVSWCAPTIDNNRITGNGAAWGGGGIGLAYAPAIVRDNVIENNTALQYGGAIFCTWQAATFERNVIRSNSAQNGGAFFIGGTPAPVLRNNLLYQNTASMVGGAIFASLAGGTQVVNCTIYENVAPTAGSIQSQAGSADVLNSIVWGNSHAPVGCAATYSDVQGGMAGDGNINVDPAFVSATGADFRLSAGSPCSDTATSTGAPAVDVRRVFRPQGLGVDMGAYEEYVSAAPVDPALSSITHPAATWRNSRDVVVSLSGATGTVAELDGFAVTHTQDATSSPAPLTNLDAGAAEYSFTTSADGAFYVNLKTLNAVGDWSEGTFYGPILIDTVDPVTTATAPVGVQPGPVTVSLDATDVASGVALTEYRVGAGAWTTYTGSFEVTAAGTTIVQYRSQDAAGNIEDAGELTVEINHAPVAVGDTYTTAEDTTLTVAAAGVLGNDSDADGDTITALLDTAPAHGTLTTLNTDGSFVYEPGPDFNGTDSFKYVVDDDVALSEAATVTINVTPQLDSAEIAGANRYLTAIQISQDAFPDGADAVVIATGEKCPDALGGSALAGVLDAPILLTTRSSLLPEVAEEIKRLGAKDVYVLGGVQALSDGVSGDLAELLGGTGVHRIGGSDRYRTAELVAQEVIDLQDESYDGKAFVATGDDFADALAASPLAAANGWPVYLAPSPVISPATIAAMQNAGVTDVVLLGGEAAMPAGTEITILGAGFGVERIDGVDRYATAVKVAQYGVSESGMSWSDVGIATGESYADALAGGAAQGARGSVMLLTKGDALSASTESALSAHKAEIQNVRFLGGLTAVTKAVRDRVILVLQTD